MGITTGKFCFWADLHRVATWPRLVKSVSNLIHERTFFEQFKTVCTHSNKYIHYLYERLVVFSYDSFL